MSLRSYFLLIILAAMLLSSPVLAASDNPNEVSAVAPRPLMVEIVAGTDRMNSTTSKLAAIVSAKLSAQGVLVRTIDLSKVTASFGDIYSQPPSMDITPYQDRFDASDGVVFVVPTYNGSMPGAVKLFLDKLRYPAAFRGKSVAFVGQSGTTDGGRPAIDELTKVILFMKGAPFHVPVFFPNIDEQLSDDQTTITNPQLEKRLTNMLASFHQTVTVLRELPEAKAAKKCERKLLESP